MIGRMRVDKAKKGTGSIIASISNKMEIRRVRLMAVKSREITRRRRPSAKKADTALSSMRNGMSRKMSATAERDCVAS